MPTLKYRDPTDGQFKPLTVSTGGGGGLDQATADGLYVNVAGDTMTGPLALPADPAQPLEAATKQYVDTTAVSVAGDTMTGALNVIAPTVGQEAARFADSIPRFVDTAARDAFYTALPGGVQDGMQCVVGIPRGEIQIRQDGAWLLTPSGQYYSVIEQTVDVTQATTLPKIPVVWDTFQTVPFGSYGLIPGTASGLTIPRTGVYVCVFAPQVTPLGVPAGGPTIFFVDIVPLVNGVEVAATVRQPGDHVENDVIFQSTQTKALNAGDVLSAGWSVNGLSGNLNRFRLWVTGPI